MVLTITSHSSANAIEAELYAQFRHVKWIGEIELSREQFSMLGHVLRAYGVRDGELSLGQIERLPLYTFITSMVFTARYAEFADDETPSFWRKYAQMVWQLPVADQQFQNIFRQQFRRVRAVLEEQYEFYFPHKLDTFSQDVVGGIYTHAIVPSYLEDDFAAWIVDLFGKHQAWIEFSEATTDAIATRIRGHSSLSSVRRRLRHFIENESTLETAARFVQTMALAVEEVALGKRAEDVSEMLSLVERAVWDQLRPLLAEVYNKQTKSAMQRRSRSGARVSLAWDLVQRKSAVQIESFHVPGDTTPDRLVWADTLDGLSTYSHHIDVYATRTDSGWLIERAYISDIKLGGWVAAVAWTDMEDRILGEPVPVTNLPDRSILFFEIDEDSRFAPVCDIDQVKDGRYVISCIGQPTLTQAQDGSTINFETSIAPLDLLADKGHTFSSIFQIVLPVNIQLEDELIPLRYRRGSLRAGLEGRIVAGIAAWATPVFMDIPQLRIKSGALFFDQDNWKCVRIRLTAGTSTLREIILGINNTRIERNDLVIDLSESLRGWSGIVELTVLHEVSKLLRDPLKFAVLPSRILVEGPACDGYYSVESPPRTLIVGAGFNEIESDSGHILVHGDQLQVEWLDPLKPVRLQISGDGTRIPLEWNVQWRHAWISPENSLLIPADLDITTLCIRGARHEQFAIHTGQWGRRQVDLDARGTYGELISRSTVRDLLQACPLSRVPVTVSDGRTTWLLFTYIKGGQGQFDTLPPIVQSAIYTARYIPTRPGGRWLNTGLNPAALLALPPEKLSAIPTANAVTLNPVLEAIKYGATLPYEKLAGWALPNALILRMKLERAPVWLSFTSATMNEGSHEGYGEIVLSPADAGRQTEQSVRFVVHWTLSELGCEVRFKPYRDHIKLLQCAECGNLFADNLSAKAQHSHGRGWNLRHRDLSEPTQARIELDPEGWLRDDWSPNLDAITDRSVIRTYRIHRQQFSNDDVEDLLSISGYRAAVYEWVCKLANSAQRNELITLKDSSIASSVELMLGRVACIENNLLRRLFLDIMRALPEKQDDSWYRLDRNLLGLAIIVRTMAWGLGQWNNAEVWSSKESMLNALTRAIEVCPTLTAWAFALVESYLGQLAALPTVGTQHEPN